MIYISHLLPDADMKEVIAKTGAGIESIEFSVSENLDNFERTLTSYKQRMEYIGTSELVIHGPFLDLNPVAFDSEIREVTKRRFGQAYTAAVELGAKKVVFHTGMIPGVYLLTGWAERMADFLSEFLETRQKIEVVMENVFDREWKPLLEVEEMVKAPNFHLCLDIGHAHCRSDIPVEDWASCLGNSISHVHIHDNKGDTDTHMGLGHGSIPVTKVFSVLKNRKNLTFTIECSDRNDVLCSYSLLMKVIGK